MHDEANAFYTDMVDQTSLGHQFLVEEFGIYPKVQWQIDPFGHTATQASLLSYDAGYESLFFWRIDKQDRDQRAATKSMELLWQASKSDGPANSIFTGVMFYGSIYAREKRHRVVVVVSRRSRSSLRSFVVQLRRSEQLLLRRALPG
jgi:hypothetical protein